MRGGVGLQKTSLGRVRSRARWAGANELTSLLLTSGEAEDTVTRKIGRRKRESWVMIPKFLVADFPKNIDRGGLSFKARATPPFVTRLNCRPGPHQVQVVVSFAHWLSGGSSSCRAHMMYINRRKN